MQNLMTGSEFALYTLVCTFVYESVWNFGAPVLTRARSYTNCPLIKPDESIMLPAVAAAAAADDDNVGREKVSESGRMYDPLSQHTLVCLMQLAYPSLTTALPSQSFLLYS